MSENVDHEPENWRRETVLRDLYLDRDWSVSNIAEWANVSDGLVLSRISNVGIQRKTNHGGEIRPDTLAAKLLATDPEEIEE